MAGLDVLMCRLQETIAFDGSRVMVLGGLAFRGTGSVGRSLILPVVSMEC